MLRALLPHCNALVATSNSSSPAREAGELAARVRLLGGAAVTVEPDLHRALDAARELAGRDGVVLATSAAACAQDDSASRVRRPSPVLRPAPVMTGARASERSFSPVAACTL